MRVLLVTEDIPARQVGGLGKHVVNLGNALLREGHIVSLMGRADRDYEASREEIGFDGDYIPGFSLQGIGWKEHQIGVWWPYRRRFLARRVAAAIRAHADHFDAVHYHGHLPLVGTLLPAGLRFLQTRHDQGSECITHMRFRDGMACDRIDPASCAGCARPSPDAIRTLVSAAAVSQYRRDVAEAFARFPTVFVSRFLMERFRRVVPAADLSRAVVVHNFVDVRKLARQAAAAGEPVAGRLLCVGRLDQAKGIAAFAAELLPRLQDGQCLRVVGDGEELPLLAELGRRWPGRLELLGWRPNAEVIQMTRTAHLCVVPSVWEEPCATTILEPLVLGRPVLALAAGGTPELACYERYAGQLQLAPNLKTLAVAAVAALAQPPCQLPLIESSAADVAEALSQLLALYRGEPLPPPVLRPGPVSSEVA